MIGTPSELSKDFMTFLSKDDEVNDNYNLGEPLSKEGSDRLKYYILSNDAVIDYYIEMFD